MIMKCVCKHVFQDARYGKWMRVMNPINKPEKHAGNNWRCTVCLAEHR